MPRADRRPKADHRYGAGAHTASAQRQIRVTGLLRQVELRREQRDRAALAVDATGADGEDRARLRAEAGGAQDALDLAIMMALADRNGPSPDRIAAAAGTDAYGLEHVRQRLSPPGPRRAG